MRSTSLYIELEVRSTSLHQVISRRFIAGLFYTIAGKNTPSDAVYTVQSSEEALTISSSEKAMTIASSSSGRIASAAPAIDLAVSDSPVPETDEYVHSTADSARHPMISSSWRLKRRPQLLAFV